MRRVTLLILMLVVLIIDCNAIRETSQRPNVLVIITDQLQAEALSCAGNPHLSTPNIDKLAKRGVRFEKAYVSFPLCVPSRSSIITGKMPHEIGVFSNEKGNKEMDRTAKANSIGHKMSQSGYTCVYAGKWHAFEPSMVEGYGFKSIAPFGDIGLAKPCVDFLDKQKDESNPFLLVASFDNPHNICEWARSQPLPYGNVDPVDIQKTPELPVNFMPSPFEPEVVRIEQQANRRVYAAQNFTPEQWRHYRYTYYRLVEKVDAEIGMILNALESNGLDKNTLVIFTSDHGDGNASHQWNQKTALFEESIKVPLIISAPEQKYRGVVSSTLVSIGLDLMPTIFDYTGIDPSDKMRGQSLKRVISNKERGSKDFIVVETMFDGNRAHKTKGRAVVGERFKYVLYSWGNNREQLFDLKSDPGEMVNLAASSRYRKELELFRKRLFDWCKKTNDYQFLKKIVLPTNAGSSSQLFEEAY